MNSLRQLFLHNALLKGLSLILATLLWFQVSSQQTVQRTVSVPVEFANLPLDLEIVNEHTRHVDLEVISNRGSAAIEEQQLSAVIDLRSARAGSQIFQLTEENISRAQGIEIRNITPSRIRLELEKTLTKSVQILPRVEGMPAEGYELVNIQAVPAQLLVSGPESLIARAGSVRSGPVSVEGATGSRNLQTYVDLEEPRLRINGPSEVTVIAVIEEKRKPIRIAGVPVRLIPEESPFRLVDRTVTVVGTLPISFEEQLDDELFEATVDTSALDTTAETLSVSPLVEIPVDYFGLFRVQKTDPERVRIRKVR